MEYVQQHERSARILLMKRDFSASLQMIEDMHISEHPLVECDFAFVKSPACGQSIDSAGNIEMDSTSHEHSTAAGQGITNCLRGTPATFIITAKNSKGFKRMSGGDVFQIMFNVQDTEVEIEDMKDGTYKVTYCVPIQKADEEGDDSDNTTQVAILLRGKHIKESPFVIANDVRITWSNIGLKMHGEGKDGNAFAGNGMSRDPNLIANAWAKVMGYQTAIRWEVKVGGMQPPVYHFEKGTLLDKVKVGDMSVVKFTNSYRGSDPVVYNLVCK